MDDTVAPHILTVDERFKITIGRFGELNPSYPFLRMKLYCPIIVAISNAVFRFGIILRFSAQPEWILYLDTVLFKCRILVWSYLNTVLVSLNCDYSCLSIISLPIILKSWPDHLWRPSFSGVHSGGPWWGEILSILTISDDFITSNILSLHIMYSVASVENIIVSEL